MNSALADPVPAKEDRFPSKEDQLSIDPHLEGFRQFEIVDEDMANRYVAFSNGKSAIYFPKEHAMELIATHRHLIIGNVCINMPSIQQKANVSSNFPKIGAGIYTSSRVGLTKAHSDTVIELRRTATTIDGVPSTKIHAKWRFESNPKDYRRCDSSEFKGMEQNKSGDSTTWKRVDLKGSFKSTESDTSSAMNMDDLRDLIRNECKSMDGGDIVKARLDTMDECRNHYLATRRK